MDVVSVMSVIGVWRACSEVQSGLQPSRGADSEQPVMAPALPTFNYANLTLDPIEMGELYKKSTPKQLSWTG